MAECSGRLDVVEIVLPIAVLAMLLVFVAQIRRLISHAILNRTIRKALELDPGSARLLIDKLEPRARWPDGLVGWIILVASVALGSSGLFGAADERHDMVQVAVIGMAIGAGILLYAWWVERSTPTV